MALLVESPERAILDTSVVIADGVAPISGAFAISAVTLAELHFGVLVVEDPGCSRRTP